MAKPSARIRQLHFGALQYQLDRTVHPVANPACDALLWVARAGPPWRDIPEQLGAWNVVYQRYGYWCKKGHSERLFQGVQQPDM